MLEEIISYILVYMNLSIVALAISVLFDKKMEISMIFTIAGISLVEYFFGLFFGLKIANCFVIILSLFCIVYLIYKGITCRNKELFLHKFSIEYFILTILYILSVFLYQNKLVVQHNELGFWGLSVKNMVYYDSIIQPNTNILHLSYIPMTGMFAYFFSQFFDVFKDGYMYIASTLLQYNIILACLSFIEEKNIIKKILFYIFCIGICFIISPLVFTSLYVDPIVSIMGGFVLIYLLNIKDVNYKEIIISICFCSFLSLIKESGLLLSIIIVIIFLIKLLKEKKNVKTIILLGLLLLCVMFGLRNLYSVYLKSNNLDNIYIDSSEISLERIVLFIKGEGEPYQYEAIKKYFDYLLKNGTIHILNTDLPVITCLFISSVVMISMYFLKKDRETLYLTISVFIFNIMFLLMLMITYVFVYGEWDAINLTAIVRYVQTLSLVNIVIMFYCMYKTCNHKGLVILLMFVIIVIDSPNRSFKEILRNETIINNMKIKRDAYSGIEEYIELFDEKDKILIVCDYPEMNNNELYKEFALLNIKYQIAPNRAYMFLEEDATEQDIEDKIFAGYTYVFFEVANDRMKEKYSFLLDPQLTEDDITNDSLFKVVIEDESVILRKVEYRKVISKVIE